jgi:hypothetical protein
MIYQKNNETIFKRERFDLDANNYVYLRELSFQELYKYQQHTPGVNEVPLDSVCDCLARCIVNEQGEPIFTDADDCKANLNVGMSVLQAMQKKVFNMSDIGVEKKDA